MSPFLASFRGGLVFGRALVAFLVCAASSASARQEVTQVEVETPAAARFNLHFTVPLPLGTWPDGGLLPLKVVLPGGAPVADTQMEAVTRFAAPAGTTGDVEVAEVIARVTKDASWVPGQRVRYSVVLAPGGTQPTCTPGLPALSNGPTSVGAGVQGLLGNENNIVVLAKDPLGNHYYALPLRGLDGIECDRYGPYVATMRFHEVMRPAAGTPPSGGYPHMMSVHAYVSTRSLTNNLTLDLRITNGTDGADGVAGTVDDILGKVYFESLSLLVISDPALDWRAQSQFVDPFGIPASYIPNTISFRGNTYAEFPLVSALPPSGEVQPCHMMPAKGQFHRRLVVSPAAGMAVARELLDGQGQGFVVRGQNSSGVPFWSWFNDDTAAYFPQRTKLADLSFTNGVYGGLPDLRSILTYRYTALRDALANNTPGSGAPDFVDLPGYHYGSSTQLGWARPLGRTVGYEHGGQGIQFLDGERAIAATSLDGFRYLQLLHRMHAERHPNVMWGSDGEPSFQDKWLFNSPSCSTCPTGPNGVPSQSSLSFYMDDGPSDPRFVNVPNWTQNQNVVANGRRPAYDGAGFWENLPGSYSATNLNAFSPHWSSHLIRYLGFPTAVAYISNDPLAKDDVLAQGEMARMTFTEYPNPGYVHSPSLYALTQAANGSPHCGTYGGRQQGWMLDAGVAAYAFESTAWRARTKVWFDRSANMLSTALGAVVDSSFLNQATGLPYTYGVLGSTINDQFNFPTGPGGAQIYKGVQSWENMIFVNAVRGIQYGVLPSGDPNVTPLRTVSKRTLLALLCPTYWSESGHTVLGKVILSAIASGCSFYNCDSTSTTCGPGTNPQPAGSNGGEAGHYFPNALAQGYLASLDNLFLQKAFEYLSFGGTCASGCTASILAQIQSTMDPTDLGYWSTNSNLVPLLALVQ
jgi:hypothetical protein